MKRNLSPSVLLVAALFTFCSLTYSPCSAQNDTIKVLAYNTLGFGPGGCQGAMPPLYADLKTIFQFATPDVLGLDKLQCVDTGPTDFQGVSPYTFPDTVISECFSPNYSYCPFTDVSGCADNCSSIVFYNQTKLGYVSTTILYSGQEDIDLFKLYYKDPYLPTTHDTTFLYIVPCHTISGAVSAGRDSQDSTVINKLKSIFTIAPNVVYMGDFNTRSSSEPGYEYITQTDANANFTFDDPPFHPDGLISYPLNWNSTPTGAAKELTTTTRSTTVPNSCGTTGGGKDWYDHIFISPWIVNNTNYISYIRNSYTTIGNDGNRIGVSINSGSNSSAPANVINALFNFSDKYPVMVSLGVTNHPLGVPDILEKQGSIKVNNPIADNTITLHFASFMNGQNVIMDVYDVCGRDLYKSAFVINSSTITKDISLSPGVYMLRFSANGYNTTLKVVKQ